MILWIGRMTITRKLIYTYIFQCLNFYIKHFAKMSVKFWRTNDYVNFMNLGECHLTLNLTLASDLFETLLIFEIATEEQIQLTKSTTGCTSNTDECIFHITWVQNCNPGAAKKKKCVCCQNYVCLDFLWCFFNIMFSKTTNCTGP